MYVCMYLYVFITVNCSIILFIKVTFYTILNFLTQNLIIRKVTLKIKKVTR